MNENNLIKKFLNLKGEKNMMRNIKKFCNDVVCKIQVANSAVCNFFKEKKRVVVRTMKKQSVKTLVMVILLAVIMGVIVITPTFPAAYLYVHLFKDRVNMGEKFWLDSVVAVSVMGVMFAVFGRVLARIGKVDLSNESLKKSLKESVSVFSLAMYKCIMLIAIAIEILRHGCLLVQRDGRTVAVSGTVVRLLKKPYGDLIDENVKKEIDKNFFKNIFKSEREIKNTIK